jgi:hypothetical protein
MTDALGSNSFIGYAESNAKSVHRDSSLFGDVIEATIKGEEEKITLNTLRPGVYQNASQIISGLRKVSGGIKYPLHPSDHMILLKHLLGQVSSAQQGATAAYKHTFKGANTLPQFGLSFTKNLDQMAAHYFGVFLNQGTFDFEVGQAVMASLEVVGKDMLIGTGQSGTSTGQNAVSLPATLVVSTSDQIKLAIDGGTAVEVTIAAGAYATAAALAAAINTAIAGTAGLLDTYRNPKVACRVDSSAKVVFYSATKGAASSVAWTAGTNDAGTLLGRGTPVEAAGAATLATPSYSALSPLIFYQGKILIDGEEAEVEKLQLVINNNLQAKNVIGRNSLVGVNISQRVVSGTITKWLTGSSIWTKFRNGSTATLKIELRTGVEAATGYNYDQNIWLQDIRYGNPEPGVTGPDPIKEEVPFTAFYYDSTYQDILWDAINLATSYPDV